MSTTSIYTRALVKFSVFLKTKNMKRKFLLRNFLFSTIPISFRHKTYLLNELCSNKKFQNVLLDKLFITEEDLTKHLKTILFYIIDY